METIVALITIGANVNETDDSGMTPLTYAATWGNANALAILLENGADVNHKDKVGDTALHEVAARMVRAAAGRDPIAHKF